MPWLSFTWQRLRNPVLLPDERQEGPTRKRAALRSRYRRTGEEQGSDALRANATGGLDTVLPPMEPALAVR